MGQGTIAMELFLFAAAAILAGGTASLAAGERWKGWIVSLGCGIGGTLAVITACGVIFGSGAISASFALAYPVGQTSVVIDRLAAFFIIVISLGSFIASIYAIGYMKAYNGSGRTVGSHFFFLAVLVFSMLFVVTVQNALAFLIAWEIMSLSSFFLVIFENEKEEVFRAGINYLIAMHIGVLFLISAFVILSIKSGSLDFASFKAALAGQRNLMNLIFFLFFVGFGTKAGFVPFHTWLPRAHPAAPSHVSALMSGVMIKTGIYGILRTITFMPGTTREIAYSLLVTAVITGILGIACSIAQGNLKKLLAYSSVENIGIIGIGTGTGLLGMLYGNNTLALLGFAGALLHLLNHSIFKSLLFFGAGAVYQKTHELDIERLGGLSKTMRHTTVFFLIGSFAIAGLPPFNGFVSEFVIYWSMIAGLAQSRLSLMVTLVLSFAALAFIGAMALLSFTRAFGVAFLGSPRHEHHEAPTEVDLTMRTAMAVQCVFIVLIGLLPVFALGAVARIVPDIIGPAAAGALPAMTGLGRMAIGIYLFAGIFILLLVLRAFLLRKRTVASFKTWDCGYQAGTPRIQYTGSSFAAPFSELIKPLLSQKEHITPPRGPFPRASSYERTVEDSFEARVIDPAVNGIVKFLDLFSWIQSGNTQQYILYGLVFVIIVTLWMMGV